jgi:hypothetical protein
VDRNTTVVFPAPLMTTIAELGAFMARETAAATEATAPDPIGAPVVPPIPVAVNGGHAIATDRG